MKARFWTILLNKPKKRTSSIVRFSYPLNNAINYLIQRSFVSVNNRQSSLANSLTFCSIGKKMNDAGGQLISISNHLNSSIVQQALVNGFKIKYVWTGKDRNAPRRWFKRIMTSPLN